MNRKILMSLAILWIVFGPVAQALFLARSYSLQNPGQLFGLAFSNVIPLLFPIAIIAIVMPGIIGDLGVGNSSTIRTRATLMSYVAKTAGKTAVLSALLHSVGVLVTGLAAFWLIPKLGWVEFVAEPGETVKPFAEQATWTQLASAGTPTFLASYAVWVGVCAFAFGVLAISAALWIGNRFAAYTAPFLALWVADYVMAIAQRPEFSISAAIFPFRLHQFPIWTAFLPISILMAAGLGSILVAKRLDFQTPGVQ